MYVCNLTLDCGTQLRLDDPMALKEVILLVQEKALQVKIENSKTTTPSETPTSNYEKSLEGLPSR